MRVLINKEKYSDQVFDILKSKIINNVIKPGSKLKIEEIEREYGISKTPLKEALNKLEYEGYVTVKSRSGTYVSIPTKEEVKQIYELRQAIEWQAIQLSIGNIPIKDLLKLKEDIIVAEQKIEKEEYDLFFDTDVRLHKMIVDYSGNKYILKVKEMIDDHIHWFRILGAINKTRPYKSSARHQEIVEALIKEDRENAALLIKLHTEEVKIAVIHDITFDIKEEN